MSLFQVLASTLGRDSKTQWSSLIGIVTAIVGNVVISFALNIQRYAHIRIEREHASRQEGGKQRYKHSGPTSPSGYDTIRNQERIAEERAKLNATAPGPGHDEERALALESQPLDVSFHSDSTANPDEEDDESEDRKSYLKSPYWWLGIVLMTIGEAGNFLAYGFAPASVVSPLGVVALISNCLIAPLMLKERFRQRDFWGVLIAIGGAVTVVLSAKTSEVRMGPGDLWDAIRRWEFLTYIGITAIFIIILMFASPRYGRKAILIDIGLVALSGGYTALSTKGVASMLSGSLFKAFTYPITYALVVVLVVSALLQIRYVNRALSNYDSTQVIPTQFVLFTLSVIVGSAVLYRDFEKTDLDHVIKFVCGCLLTFGGVWLITSGRKNEDDVDLSEAAEDEAIRLIDEETDLEQDQKPMRQTRPSVPAQIASSTSFPAVESYREPPSVPSVEVTPSDQSDHLKTNFPMTSVEYLPRPSDRPTTPPQTARSGADTDGTPFFTPSSIPGPARSHVPLPLRADSSPGNPSTPTKMSQGTSKAKPDDSGAPRFQAADTPPPTLFRSARGSISRLIPGPLIQPLSSSLSTIVADSLLRGEGTGSPRIGFGRQSSLRRSRSDRRRSTGVVLDAGPEIVDQTPRSAIESPSVSRWSTREERPLARQSGASDVETSSGRQPERRLGSFGGVLANMWRKPSGRRKDKEVERGENNDHERT